MGINCRSVLGISKTKKKKKKKTDERKWRFFFRIMIATGPIQRKLEPSRARQHRKPLNAGKRMGRGASWLSLELRKGKSI